MDSQTASAFDFIAGYNPGAFTALVYDRFKIRDGVSNTWYRIFGAASVNHVWSGSVFDFQNSTTKSTIRNSAAALSIAGGSASSTEGVTIEPVNASSTTNFVSFKVTGNYFNLLSAVGSRVTKNMEISGSLTAVNGNTLTNATLDIIPTINVGTSTLTQTGINYNPTITAGTTTHYAMRIQSGLSAIGHTNVPTAALDIAASITAASSFRIRSGTAPSSPNDGDIWYDGTDIKIRVGGTTKTFTII